MTRLSSVLLVLLSTSCVTAARQKSAVAQTELGAAYLREGSLPDAVASLERAVKADPRNWDAWQTLALAYAASRAHDKAHDAFERAVDIAPESGEVNTNYGAYLVTMGELDEAIERFDVATHDLTYRNGAYTLSNLGIALYSKGELDRSIAVLTDAIQRAPNQWQARFHRGLAYQAKGDPRRAASDFDAVIELCKGKMPQAYFQGARSQFELGNGVAGCAYLDQVLQGEPSVDEQVVAEAGQLFSQQCAGSQP